MNQLMIKKKNELTTNKKKGFTLIELIIVIAIIAILAAVAIPKFGAVRKDASISSDQANAKIIAIAVASAVADGKASPDTETVYKTYIDGGEVPKVKSVDDGTWTVKYDTSLGVTVKVGDTYMYPANKAKDTK